MPRVTFQPAGVSIEVSAGTTIFAAALRAEVAVPSQCGGKGACALCRVTVVEGAEVVSPMRWEEEGHLGNVFHITGERLSCQTRVFGDVEVTVDEEPVKEKPRGRYIPYSLIRKREKMEAEEELRRVRASAREPRQDWPPRRGRSGGAPRQEGEDDPAGAPPSEAAGGGAPVGSGSDDARGPQGPGGGRRSRRRGRSRGRKRNPGAPRPGDHLPPPGKAGKG